MAKYERMVNEDGELGIFIPETDDVIIRTTEEIARAKMYAELATKQRFHHGRNYFVSYNEAVAAIIKDLTLIEAGSLVKLLLQLRLKGEGKLLHGKKSLNKADIARLLGRAKSNTNVIIRRLTEIGVLEYDNAYFSINSKYHTMGETIASELFTKVYTVRARDIIGDLKLNEIGMLYKIIPFFHYSEYYLCVDSNAPEDDIEYIRREGLAEAIGHDVATVTKIMNRLQSAGAILVTGTRKEVRYLVHPDLMFRQKEGFETEWTRSVRKLFADHAKKSVRK